MISEYRGRAVLITGGLGFIGSNLATKLAQAGADVTIIDSIESGCGANFYNIASVRQKVRVVCADIGDILSCAQALQGAEFIFNLAGDVSHSRSMQDPERDLALNAQSQLRFLLGCRERCPNARVVYAGTRQVYGQHERLPVDEDHPIHPVDFNGVHKFAATQYHLLLSRRGDLDCVVLRLSNVYGPRMALHLPQQGFLGVYFRNAVEGQPILIYGPGDQLRDPVHADDVVDAILRAGAATEPRHRIYNIGGSEALPIAEIAAITARLGGRSELRHIPFPDELRGIDIGSYFSDTGRARSDLGWEPKMCFEDGVRQTLGYFRQHLPHYLPLPSWEPAMGPDGTQEIRAMSAP